MIVLAPSAEPRRAAEGQRIAARRSHLIDSDDASQSAHVAHTPVMILEESSAIRDLGTSQQKFRWTTRPIPRLGDEWLYTRALFLACDFP